MHSQHFSAHFPADDSHIKDAPEKEIKNPPKNFFSEYEVVEPNITDPGIVAYNPYPYLGAPSTPCWPRGFPIDLVQNSQTWETKVSKIEGSPNFGVLQSLADIQPDVDAMYRLTHKTPFAFQKKPKGKSNQSNGENQSVTIAGSVGFQCNAMAS